MGWLQQRARAGATVTVHGIERSVQDSQTGWNAADRYEEPAISALLVAGCADRTAAAQRASPPRCGLAVSALTSAPVPGSHLFILGLEAAARARGHHEQQDFDSTFYLSVPIGAGRALAPQSRSTST